MVKRALNQGNTYGVLLTDLCKTYDELGHHILMAELYAYGYSLESLKLLMAI